MHSERAFWDDGQFSEYGAELIDTDHTTIRALAKRFDLELLDVLAAEPRGGEQTISLGGEYYREADLFRDFRALYPILSAQVEACGPQTTYARSTSAGRELDATSIGAWIAKFVPGGRASRLGRYLAIQYLAEYGIDVDAQSSLNMVYWLGRQPDYDRRTGEFNALGPSDERFHIKGGNDRLPRAIAASLPADTVRSGYRLEAIARRSDGRIDLDFATDAGSETKTVDRAIVTIPFVVLRDLDLSRAGFDERKMRAIDELAYGDHSKLIVEFDRRFWTETGAWPGRSNGDLTYDGAFVQTWEGSRALDGENGLLVNFAAGPSSAAFRGVLPYTTSATAATAAYATRFARELDRVLPGAKHRFTGRATLSHLTADPFARGSYSGWLKGQYVAFSGYEGARQGNVLFAGEHCSVRLQGFMEGAAREGIRAAAEALA